jgi:hypothetical protein
MTLRRIHIFARIACRLLSITLSLCQLSSKMRSYSTSTGEESRYDASYGCLVFVALLVQLTSRLTFDLRFRHGMHALDMTRLFAGGSPPGGMLSKFEDEESEPTSALGRMARGALESIIDTRMSRRGPALTRRQVQWECAYICNDGDEAREQMRICALCSRSGVLRGGREIL